MKATIEHVSGNLEIDFSLPIDISVHTSNDSRHAKAWYVDTMEVKPVRSENFIGSVKEGGSVNFRDISFNPHGHSTHTESYGHIDAEIFDVQKCFTTYFFKAQVITVHPVSFGEEDQIIPLAAFNHKLAERIDAIIIRTMPNDESKKERQWSGSNWPYLTEEAAKYIADNRISHLLIDLPSVDREFDDGKLLAHRAFWQYPKNIRKDATITEMIYVPEDVADGLYMLSLQPASFINDASPSKPVIYKILNQ